MRLRPAYEAVPHCYVVNHPVTLPRAMEGRTTFITHSERDWKVLINLWEAWRILRRERPTVLLSTGAGCIVPFALVGRLLGIQTLYVETLTSVSRPSLTGRLMRYLAARCFYQWPALAPWFPRGTYGGLR